MDDKVKDDAVLKEVVQAKLTEAEHTQLKFLQEKVISAQKDVQIAQAQMQIAQKSVELALKDQVLFVKGELWNKYGLHDGDGINIADGTIIPKGDPNLTIGKKEPVNGKAALQVISPHDKNPPAVMG